MEFFRRNIRKLGKYSYIVFALFLLTGCAGRSQQAVPVSEEVKDTSDQAEERQETVNSDAATNTDTDTNVDTDSYVLQTKDLIRWDQVKEAETEDYYIVAVQEETEDGKMAEYPQIVPKEGKEIYCGTEQINELLKRALYWPDYNILYADRHYISVWKGRQEKTGAVYVINLQCPVVQMLSNTFLSEVQDDNDYRDAPWPSNGITLSLDAVLEEIEKGNCYTDDRGYALYRENPQAFLDSARRQFAEIKAGGYEEAYWTRSFLDDQSKMAYRMYLREGRAGFYIHPIEEWEKAEQEKFYTHRDEPIDTSLDFRIEVAYDWQEDAPAYHMPYEVYGELCESEKYGSFYYPQIRGLDETITASLNAAMKEDLDENLAYMDLDAWNERMREYGHEQYWDELPRLMNPNVTYQTEKYLCIWQDLDFYDFERFTIAEEWKRYHVYDVETGQSLKLGDMIRLDEDFALWLKQEKKIKATFLLGMEEGMSSVYEREEWLKKELDDYPEEILLDVLENAEFWLKEGRLFIRLPEYNLEMYNGMVYTYGGNAWPNFLQYYEVRITLDDLQGFLLTEPWGE